MVPGSRWRALALITCIFFVLLILRPIESKEVKVFMRGKLFLVDEIKFDNNVDYKFEQDEDDNVPADLDNLYDEKIAALPQYILHERGKNVGLVRVPIVTRRGGNTWSTPRPKTIKGDYNTWNTNFLLPITKAPEVAKPPKMPKKEESLFALPPLKNSLEEEVVMPKLDADKPGLKSAPKSTSMEKAFKNFKSDGKKTEKLKPTEKPKTTAKSKLSVKSTVMETSSKLSVLKTSPHNTTMTMKPSLKTSPHGTTKAVSGEIEDITKAVKKLKKPRMPKPTITSTLISKQITKKPLTTQANSTVTSVSTNTSKKATIATIKAKPTPTIIQKPTIATKTPKTIVSVFVQNKTSTLKSILTTTTSNLTTTTTRKPAVNITAKPTSITIATTTLKPPTTTNKFVPSSFSTTKNRAFFTFIPTLIPQSTTIKTSTPVPRLTVAPTQIVNHTLSVLSSSNLPLNMSRKLVTTSPPTQTLPPWAQTATSVPTVVPKKILQPHFVPQTQQRHFVQSTQQQTSTPQFRQSPFQLSLQIRPERPRSNNGNALQIVQQVKSNQLFIQNQKTGQRPNNFFLPQTGTTSSPPFNVTTTVTLPPSKSHVSTSWSSWGSPNSRVSNAFTRTRGQFVQISTLIPTTTSTTTTTIASSRAHVASVTSSPVPKPPIIQHGQNRYRGPTYNCRVLMMNDGRPSLRNDYSCRMKYPGFHTDSACRCTYEVAGRDAKGCATGFLYTCQRS